MANTRSGTARLTLMMNRTSCRVTGFGLLGRAAHRVIGMEAAAASAAPATAIASVSSIGVTVRGRKEKSGRSSSPILSAPLAQLRSEEHTSELQSRGHRVCRLLLEKKKIHEQIVPFSTHNH